MKQYFLPLLALFAFILPVSAYTVQVGDTLSQVARDAKTSVRALQERNNIKNPNLIYPGQVINLPSEEKSLGGGFSNPKSTPIFQGGPVAFAPATTTLCAIQNNSGSDWVITGSSIHVNAGTSANTVNSSWSGYVSSARAGAPLAANTFYKQTAIVSSTLNLAYGTATSSVVWYSGWYANVTTTAITSSTGKCNVFYIPF
jgi:lysozyme